MISLSASGMSNGVRSIYVRDPAGNSVELTEPRLWDFPAR